MKDETDFDEEEYVRRYNEFAEEYSQTFKTHVDKLLKDAASSLSNRQFDTLTVDGPYEEVEVDVEVEGRGWLPWQKRIRIEKQKKLQKEQYKVSPGWYLKCLTIPDEVEEFEIGGRYEQSHRYWLFLEPGGTIRLIYVHWEMKLGGEPRFIKGQIHDGGTVGADIKKIAHLSSWERIDDLGLIGLDMPCPEDKASQIPGGSDRSLYRWPTIPDMSRSRHEIESLVSSCLKRKGPAQIKNDNVEPSRP